MHIFFLHFPVSPLLCYWTLFKKAFWKHSQDLHIFLCNKVERMGFVVSDCILGKKFRVLIIGIIAGIVLFHLFYKYSCFPLKQ